MKIKLIYCFIEKKVGFCCCHHIERIVLLLYLDPLLWMLLAPKMWYDLCTGHYQCEQIDGFYWMSPFSGCNCLSSQRESVMCPLVRSNFQWCVNIKIGLGSTTTTLYLPYYCPCLSAHQAHWTDLKRESMQIIIKWIPL